ncbi:hypothetical protein MNBD_DELTA02-464 [hydrothermal vent metagenome]|uniref:SAF domain-containing protein n=1 Tax=hydrothermal vent metagenome TaxID=652676 RepID=A0A3B0VB29_9ZZZZ
MTKLFFTVLMVFFAGFGLLFAPVAARGSSALLSDKVTAAIESDSRWGDASVEVSDLDLSALGRNGKGAAAAGFDAVQVRFLGQVRPGRRFNMKLVFLKDDKVLTDVMATARISVFKDVVVAMRALRIRDRIGAGDVRIERTQLRALDAPVFVSLADVVGMRVRRPFRAGAYVKREYVQPETLVRRGDKIIVVADNGVLKIRSKARALEDGYPGSVVEARTAGGKVIFGTVNKRGELSVAF